VCDKYTRVAVGLGIDADNGLAGEVLGDVGHQPVLTDDDHDVLGVEEEPVEIRALHAASTPVDRDRFRRLLEGCSALVMALLDLAEVPSAAAEEELRLTASAMDFDEFLQFGAAMNEHYARGERHGSGGLSGELRERVGDEVRSQVERADHGQLAG
jgi:hypothetical protein